MFYLRARGTRKPTRGDSNPGSGERGRGRQREHARRAGARSSCSGRGGFLLVGPCEISIVDRTGTSPVLFCPSPLHSEACKRGRVFDETKTHHIMNRE